LQSCQLTGEVLGGSMLRAIGLVVAAGTAFVITSLAVALAATPCVVALQMLYSHPPKESTVAPSDWEARYG
jgi:hypothetical protein